MDNSYDNRAKFSIIDVAIIIAMIGMVLALLAPKTYSPSFINDTQIKATQGLANALNRAAIENDTVRSAKSTEGKSIANCSDVGKVFFDGRLPMGYFIMPAPISSGQTVDCILRGPNGTSATFKVKGIN